MGGGQAEAGTQRTIGDLRDLAQRNAGGGGLDLRLAVGQGADDCGGDNLGANDLAIAGLAGTALGVGSATGQDQDLDGRALRGPVAVVQVEEVAALALVEDGRAAQGERAVGTGREARGVDGAGLRGLVVLELEVASNVARTLLRVEECAVAEGRHEDAVAGAGSALLCPGEEAGQLGDLPLVARPFTSRAPVSFRHQAKAHVVSCFSQLVPHRQSSEQQAGALW